MMPLSRPPELPQPEALDLAAGKTAVLVLDGSRRWGDTDLPCHQLVPGMKRFLKKVREAGLPIIYTVSFQKKGMPEGEVYAGLEKRPSEPVIYPDGFDKFTGGELQSYLRLYNVDTLIFTGYRANICVLHTATTAAREHKYRVVIPIDGMTAITDYEMEYTLVHFQALPKQASKRFLFTNLDLIRFS
jgi:nicotinamidase-related amidase